MTATMTPATNFIVLKKEADSFIWWMTDDKECRYVDHRSEVIHFLFTGTGYALEEALCDIKERIDLDGWRVDNCQGAFSQYAYLPELSLE